MSDVKQLGFSVHGIGSLLKANRLKVPLNQREYSWEEKQVIDLIQDFTKAIRRNEPRYFLGTIVISKENEELPEVVDGQQRLATSFIILAAIRDYFYTQEEDLLQESIDTVFLYEIDRNNREKVEKLSLNVDDKDYFNKRIIALPDNSDRLSIQETKESHNRINFAANKAVELIEGIINTNPQNSIIEILNGWISFIENKATVILLTVPDKKNAFMMFETLNDRGLKTSQSDLVKNYLFSEAGERVQEAQQKWSRMNSALEILGIDDIVMTYLRHFVITQYGPTREKEIFDRIQENVSGRLQALTFLEKLAEYATSYSAILTPTHHKWNNYSPLIRESISIIRELRVQQIRPLMLAVVQQFNPPETELAFRSFINWTVRFLISGGMRGGQLESAYAEAAQKIVQGTIITTNTLLTELTSVIPSDGTFKSAFETARVSQHYLARYYLHSIEKYLINLTDNPELRPILDTDIVNLEHIMPKEPADNWPHVEPEVQRAYTKRIGNMTLLNSKVNSQFGNAPFQTKRVEFENSRLILNQQICEDTDNQTEWGSEHINQRQQRLAEYAILTWPLRSQ